VNNGLQHIKTKQYKVFLVEIDDDKRERVICGRTGIIEIELGQDYDYDMMDVLTRPYYTRENASIKLDLIPMDDRGTLLRMENFWEIETGDDEEEE